MKVLFKNPFGQWNVAELAEPEKEVKEMFAGKEIETHMLSNGCRLLCLTERGLLGGLSLYNFTVKSTNTAFFGLVVVLGNAADGSITDVPEELIQEYEGTTNEIS